MPSSLEDKNLGEQPKVRSGMTNAARDNKAW